MKQAFTDLARAIRLKVPIPAILLVAAVSCSSSFVSGVFGQALDLLEGQEVEINVDSFGVGGGSRPAGWVPVRLSLVDYGNQARNVLVTFNTTDADGDIQAQSREVTLNPGLRTQVWLYLNLSDRVDARWTWEAQVYEFTDGAMGRQLGAKVAGPGPMVDPDTAIIGILGQRDGRLGDYAIRLEADKPPISGNEAAAIIKGLRTADLPDRWQGLTMFESLVWMPDEEPAGLSAESAGAIIEWVRRGGHLVVVMPSAGVSWRTTQLDAIMPPVVVTRWEDQELSGSSACGGLLRHISRFATLEPAPRAPAYPRITLTLFSPPNGSWEDIDTIPLMEVDAPVEGGQEGRTVSRAVVCQRPEGFGFVTMVGVPVTDIALNRPGLELPSAEVFWNQILGRRQDTPGREEMEDAAQKFRPQRDTYRSVLTGLFTEQMELDAARTGGALLLAIVIFAVYWLASGPPVYAFLKKRSQLHHAWVAFVGAAAVFTGVGWAGAMLLRREQILPRHFTILDHIANGELQRAATYINIPLDGYGTRHIEVGQDDPAAAGLVSGVSGGLAELVGPRVAKDQRWHNSVRSYFVPGADVTGFPDTRRYFTATLDQSTLAAPARNTAKQVVVEWAGAPLSGWGMPNYSRDADRPQAIYETIREGDSERQIIRLTGMLSHQLPGPLHDVIILHVTNRPVSEARIRATGDRGSPRLRVFAWALPRAWAPDEVRDLSQLGPHLPDQNAWRTDGLFDAWLRRFASDTSRIMGNRTTYGRSGSRDAMLLLSFFHQLPPPPWGSAAASSEAYPIPARIGGRELDMSTWLNRPCLIIMGYVHNSPLPTPIYVDGERIERVDIDEDQQGAAIGGSQTFVRWIYPMPVEHQPR